MPKDYRINTRIRVPEVRLVDDEGNQLGVMPTRQALQMAEERGVDLVEVAPASNPPVCRLMDYGKFRYEATRREREARREQRGKPTNELREIRIKTRIGDHDRDAKVRQVRRLLGEGSKVKVSVMFRGREITHPEVGMQVLKKVAEDLVDDALLERRPTFEGRFLAMILAPNGATTASPKSGGAGQSKKAAAEPQKETQRAEA